MRPDRWRDTFGGALTLTFIRLFFAAPLILIGLTLCLTFIGIPIGVPLMGIACKWATHPLMRLPQMNPEGDCD